jgi:tubulin polyglutamylase TTLL6/13
VIKQVAKIQFEFHLTNKEYGAWDVWWSDGPVTIHLLKRMQQHQRVNHFPGMYNLAKKNLLGRHLMRMKGLLPEQYQFFPETYNLPHDFKELIAQAGD